MSRGARREGLSRRHRFRGRDCFRPLLRNAHKLSGTLAVAHVAAAPGSASRFGISVGRRAARSAVERNRIKRCARELFRRHALKQVPIDLVITLTPRFAPDQTANLMHELAGLMDRALARFPG